MTSGLSYNPFTGTESNIWCDPGTYYLLTNTLTKNANEKGLTKIDINLSNVEV